MIIENPRYYAYEEMEKEFDGLCVCVAEPEYTRKGGRLIGGVVIVSDPSMDVVLDESQILEDAGMYPGTWSFRNFTRAEIFDSGIVEVISLEN